ncbi:MAG: sigma-70 family RNA polymerase sigma factor [Candidatus Omnitrophica bacterium]|nr:sigma-70 family RNA polymerase sigma factor [Candidatus Omnitrophota bacterium]
MSFEELTERISTKLKGIVYKIHRSSPSFSAEDLYQEAVLNLWVEYENGKLSDKTDSYILQSCYFYLKNYIRTAQDRTSLLSVNMPMESLSVEVKDSVDEDPDMDTLMEKVFNDGLSRKEKEIVFFYLQGWTTRQIGERLGVSHVSVVKLEHNIREKCKNFKNHV